MKQLFIIILVLGGAVIFTVWALEDPGYVVLGRGAWALEMTLSALIWVLAVGGICLYGILKFIFHLWQLPTSFFTKRAQQKQQKACTAIEDGFGALLCGHWQEAEQSFAKHLSTHLIHYAGAAYSAQQQAQSERASAYLKQAQENSLDDKLALTLLQTQLYLQQNDLLAAHKNVLYAKILAPEEKEVLWLLLIIYLQSANWTAVVELLPTLRKSKLLSAAQMQALQERATHRGIAEKVRAH